MLPRVDLIRGAESDWLLMNNPDHISGFIRATGAWGVTESTISKIILEQCAEANVIDAGANIGGFTIPIAKALDASGGRVHAFEPQRIAYQQLCANVFLNRLDNVYAYNLALGDTSKMIHMPELDQWKSQNIGGFSVDPDIRRNLKEEAMSGQNFVNEERCNLGQEVEQRPLDSFGFDFKISLMKVDVEGYELEFFKGANETIIESMFPPIIFELWDDRNWYSEKAEATTQFLIEMGYEFEKFGKEILALHPRHPLVCSVEREGNSVNLIVSHRN